MSYDVLYLKDDRLMGPDTFTWSQVQFCILFFIHVFIHSGFLITNIVPGCTPPIHLPDDRCRCRWQNWWQFKTTTSAPFHTQTWGISYCIHITLLLMYLHFSPATMFKENEETHWYKKGLSLCKWSKAVNSYKVEGVVVKSLTCSYELRSIFIGLARPGDVPRTSLIDH